MRGQVRTSHSACDCFEGCPLCYNFKYVDKIEPEIKFVNWAFAGSFTHETVEEVLNHFIGLGITEVMQLPDIQTSFVEKVQEVYDSKANTIPESSEKKDDDDTILNCLGNWTDFMVKRYDYLTTQDLQKHFLPVLVEKEFDRKINNVPFHGILDAAFQDIKTWAFDWKTNKDSKITESQVRQGVRYALLTDGFFPEPLNEFYVINLRKKVNLAKARIEITPELRQREFDNLGRIWKLMHAGSYPKNKKSCFFCDYKRACLMYDDEGKLCGISNNSVIDDWL